MSKTGERSIRKCGCYHQHGYYFLKLKILLNGSRISNLSDTSLQITIIIITWGSHFILLYLRCFNYIVFYFSLTTMLNTAILFSGVNICYLWSKMTILEKRYRQIKSESCKSLIYLGIWEFNTWICPSTSILGLTSMLDTWFLGCCWKKRNSDEWCQIQYVKGLSELKWLWD